MRDLPSLAAARLLTMAALMLTPVLGGCERLRALKQSLRAPVVAAQGAPRPHETRLEVWVSPADSISITLDGVKVATHSPFETNALAAGGHVLEVRAMGHYAVTLPLSLEAGRTTRMPVSLRPRPPRAFTGRAQEERDAPPRPAPRASVRQPSAPPRAHSGIETTPPAPLQVRVETRPELPLEVDGVPTTGREPVLRQTMGVLSLGTIALPYELLLGRGLEFIVPDDEAAWYVDGRQVKVRSRIRMGRTPLYVTRQIAGSEQRITLRPLL